MKLQVDIEAMKSNIAKREEVLEKIEQIYKDEDRLTDEIAEAKEELEFMRYAMHRYEQAEEKNRNIVEKLDWRLMLYGEDKRSCAAFDATRAIGN